jgi:hypothetical protein
MLGRVDDAPRLAELVGSLSLATDLAAGFAARLHPRAHRGDAGDVIRDFQADRVNFENPALSNRSTERESAEWRIALRQYGSGAVRRYLETAASRPAR